MIAHFRPGATPGAPGRPPVIAVSGITGNGQSWVAVARALAGRADLIATDLRGRGRSSELPGPYGLDVHVADLVALLDELGADRAVLAGHSLGAYIVAMLAVAHPERVHALVLVDGGLEIPGTEGVDPQAFATAFLGPALARLSMRFPSREAYRAWWRQHPALGGSEVSDADLAAYADRDLVGTPPDMHSAVREEAVRADAGQLLPAAAAAHRLTVPATLLCAPRGLINDEHPMQPFAAAWEWAAADPERRRAELVADVNHYTITLGAPGAAAVADAIAATVGQ